MVFACFYNGKVCPWTFIVTIIGKIKQIHICFENWYQSKMIKIVKIEHKCECVVITVLYSILRAEVVIITASIINVTERIEGPVFVNMKKWHCIKIIFFCGAEKTWITAKKFFSPGKLLQFRAVIFYIGKLQETLQLLEIQMFCIIILFHYNKYQFLFSLIVLLNFVLS